MPLSKQSHCLQPPALLRKGRANKVLYCLNEHHEAYNKYEDADNKYHEAHKALHDFLLKEQQETKSGEKTEIYLFEGIKITLFYRISKAGLMAARIYDVMLNYNKYELDDFDAKPLQKLESEKAYFILNFYNKTVSKKQAENTRTTCQAKYYEAKQDAIKTLGFRKPIKYRDVIWQVFIAGYYGERELQMQDAEIKELK